MASAIFSAIIRVGKFVLPRGIVGIISPSRDASLLEAEAPCGCARKDGEIRACSHLAGEIRDRAGGASFGRACDRERERSPPFRHRPALGTLIALQTCAWRRQPLWLSRAAAMRTMEVRWKRTLIQQFGTGSVPF